MNTHTKQQQDKVFETDFIGSQKSDLLALSQIAFKYHYTCRTLLCDYDSMHIYI